MKDGSHKQGTRLLYGLIKPISPLMYKAYFQKIYISNAKKVPQGKPVLLAANHPTAFIEPMLLCSYLDAPVHNITRGDIFKKPFFRKLLESLHMIPIYRIRDGYGESDRNDEVFEGVVEKLKENSLINIFVEGGHHKSKRVNPVKKGITRIAFSAFEKYALHDLQIIPTGINFTNDGQPRTGVFVNFGAPIFIRDYWPMYLVNPVRASLTLCRDIEAGMKKVCYQIDQPSDETLGDQMLEMFRSDYPERSLPLVIHGNEDRFFAEKNVLDRINTADEEHKVLGRAKTAAYFSNLAASGLKDDALCNPKRGNLLKLVWYLLGLIPFLIGRIGSYPVLGLAKLVSRKMVTKQDYYGSVRMSIGFLAGLIYFPLVFFLSLFSRNAIIIGIASLLPILGWFAMLYRESFIRWLEARRALAHHNRASLQEERENLVSFWKKTG